MPVVPEVLHVVLHGLYRACMSCSSGRGKRRHPTREAGGWLGPGIWTGVRLARRSAPKKPARQFLLGTCRMATLPCSGCFGGLCCQYMYASSLFPGGVVLYMRKKKEEMKKKTLIVLSNEGAGIIYDRDPTASKKPSISRWMLPVCVLCSSAN